MRARQADLAGHAVANDGVRIWYEVHGSGPQTVFLLPTWPALDARVWKLQVPYLARHHRVLVADPRGNGASDRPTGPEAYAYTRLVADAVAVLDASQTRSAVCVGLSMGGNVLLQLALAHPERVDGAVFVAPSVGVDDQEPACWPTGFEGPYTGQLGWAQYNAARWQEDLAGFARWFFGEVFCEPHSTKLVDDAVEWTLEAGADTLIDIQRARYPGGPTAPSGTSAIRLAGQLRCPSLVLTGDDDRVVDPAISRAIAEALGCPLEVVSGGGHGVPARHPVWFNQRLHRFIHGVSARSDDGTTQEGVTHARP
jgi:pimeloyl-ACP methyl ester carboxylesterase